MNYAKIENNTIVDCIVADEDFINSQIFKDNHPGDWIKVENGEGIGWVHDGTKYAPPTQPEIPAVVDPCEWLIDLGFFYDRFGVAKMDVLMSEDAGVKVRIANFNIRDWIDLKKEDVSADLAYISSQVPSLTTELQNSILTTPVTADENRALRKKYF